MTRPRTAGLTIPLFSIRTQRGWGIGEIPDLVDCARWAKSGGLRLVQILPAHTLAAGETSPYGAMSAFGLDPVYLALDHVEELDAELRATLLGHEGTSELDRLRAASTVDYAGVRALKGRVLRAAFDRFRERHWPRSGSPTSDRGRALAGFIEREADWAEDYALYVALRREHDEHGWSTWPEGERDRRPDALAAARTRLADEILFEHYAQWLAHEQWVAARRGMQELGVELMGDLPFVVGSESADVWAHHDQFRHDASLGAPPDGFTPDGQDWGLPPYDWKAMEASKESWIRARTRRAAALYDRFRLDHVVGFFRMFVLERAADGEKGARGFDPPTEEAQLARGMRELGAVQQEAGAVQVIAEDLGVIPDFVRKALGELGVPGYRVLPWEREWEEEGKPYRVPAEFPAASVAAWSTHDTAPINTWWTELEEGDRQGLAEIMGVDAEADGHTLWRAQMRLLLGAGSQLALVQPQEVLGEGGRVNMPGKVGPENWCYRLPQPIETLETDPTFRARLNALREMAAAARR